MRSWPESGANSSWDLMAGATSNIHPIMLGLAMIDVENFLSLSATNLVVGMTVGTEKEN